MWGSNVFFNSFISNARGLAVLIKDDANLDNLTSENIIPGNYSKLSMTAGNKRILPKCIYTLNEDSKPEDEEHESTCFFRTVFNDDNEDGYEHKVITGDFNVALKHNKDMCGYLHVYNPHSKDKMKMNLGSLVDIWRERNPTGRQFTFDKRQERNQTRAKLDYFLVSENSTENIG